jgi:hypothetical protein
LIDHGAALYFHHDWENAERFVGTAFPPIQHHVLLPWAAAIEEADAELRMKLTPEVFTGILQQVPAAWLAQEKRAMYADLLTRRLANSSNFVEEAARARAKLV